MAEENLPCTTTDPMADIKESGDDAVLISEVEQSDLDSLTTILARSFHPVNPYVAQALPDTPAMRDWWKRIYSEAIESSTCRVLVARRESEPDMSVVGVLPLRLISAKEDCGGFWTSPLHPWTTDHDESIWQPSISLMTEQEKEVMKGRKHFLLELLAVDHAYKHQGIGSRLLTKACDIADQTGCPIFLQAHSKAAGFYKRLDFEAVAEAILPGEAQYLEYELVREPKTKST